MTGFVFPCHPLDPLKVDPAYASERDALRAAGHAVYWIDTDRLPDARPHPPLPVTGERLIYRGWMLTTDAYAHLYEALGQRLVTSPEAYVSSHHLPEWFAAVADLTMPSTWGPANRAVAHFETLQEQGTEQAFVKDYVKSLSTGEGSRVRSPADVARVMNDILTFKGFIEGGVVFRQWVALDDTSEVRFFVLHGKVQAPHAQVSPALLALAQLVNLRHRAPFYTVDIMNTAQGQPIVVEIGDGQVSEPRGWAMTDFVALFS